MTLQETIIAQLGVKPSINPKEEIRKSVDFLKAYIRSFISMMSICRSFISSG